MKRGMHMGASLGRAIAGMNRSKLMAMAAVFAGAVLVPSLQPAKAALIVTLQETGFAPVSATDSANTGNVSFTGPYGDFKTNIVVGFSNKLDPTHGPEAQLEIQSLDITKSSGISGPVSLTVTLTDDNFAFPGASGDTMRLFSALGGTTTKSNNGDSVVFQSFADPSGATPGPQTFVSPGNPNAGPISFNVPDASVDFIRGATYSLRSVTTLTLSNTNETTNISGTTTVSAISNGVPEPTTAVAMGIIGAMMLGRRNRKPAHG